MVAPLTARPSSVGGSGGVLASLRGVMIAIMVPVVFSPLLELAT